MSNKAITLKYVDWLRVARIALAVSTDENRPILGCLQLTVATDDALPSAYRSKLTATATNGAILAVNAVDLVNDEDAAADWQLCIPAPEVAGVTKLLTTEIKRDVPAEQRGHQEVHLVTSEDVEGEPGLQLQYVHASLLGDSPKVDYRFSPVTVPAFPNWEPMLSIDKESGSRRWSCDPAQWALLASTVDAVTVTMEIPHIKSAAHFSTPNASEPLWRGVIMPVRVEEAPTSANAEGINWHD